MNEKLLKGKIVKKVFSVVLAIAMVLTLMPISDMTVYADSTPLTFTAQEANSTIKFYWSSGENVQFSTDGSTWADYSEGNQITLTSINDKVSFKGTNVKTDSYENEHFYMTGKIAASGSVTSLTNGSGGNATLTDGCYKGMFYYCESLTTAPALPSTTLESNCYNSMFYGCESLTTTPELPATNMTDYCYDSMFYGCKSLTTAPELPATTLAISCYASMFESCSNLLAAPQLSATTLANYCYKRMFQDCEKLTTAPSTLQATTLANNCYEAMFRNCKLLTATPALPATTLANECYKQMFYGCSSLTTVPELSATTLAKNCYYGMFKNCTGILSTPILPATTLAEGCYKEMFSNCNNLTEISLLPATTLADNCYYQMFSECSALKIYTTNENEGYKKPWSIPNDAVVAESWNSDMFYETGGSFTGNPVKGTIYYIAGSPSSTTHTCTGTGVENANVLSITQGNLTSGSYYLAEDVTLTECITIPAGNTVNICLNGNVLNFDSKKFWVNGTLNIYDCKSTEHKFSVDSESNRWIVNASGDKVVTGGVIYNGGSALEIQGDDAELNIYGGNIVGCNTAIYNEGTVHLYECNIWGNTPAIVNKENLYIQQESEIADTDAKVNISYNYGGWSAAAIFLGYGSTTFMYNGLLSYNKTTGNGGAVDVVNGSFHMYGGKMIYNEAGGDGGAVYNGESSQSFHMHGGVIQYNKAGNAGGGIFDKNGDTSFEGKCIVTDNKVGQNANNVYTESVFKVNDDGKPSTAQQNLSEGSLIGITKSGGVGIFASNGLNDNVQYFVSDNSNYIIGCNGDGGLYLTAISGQPTQSNGYKVTTTITPQSYQWYQIKNSSVELKNISGLNGSHAVEFDNNAISNKIVSIDWEGTGIVEINNIPNNYKKVSFTSTTSGTIITYSNYGSLVKDGNNYTYTFTGTNSTIYLENSNGTFTMENVKFETDKKIVDGATSSSLTFGEEGESYSCKVTYVGIAEEFSNEVVYSSGTTISSIAMKTNPTKTTYESGETLDLTGAKITVTNSDNTTQDIAVTPEMVSGFDSTTAGTKTVTITYEGKTTTFTVTIKPHEHTYATTWSKNSTYHWHAATCSHTTLVSNKAKHTWNSGKVTKEATTKATGVKTYTCTVCRATKTETIPKVVQTKANNLAIDAKYAVTTGKNIKVAWGKVAYADGYDVYMTYCGSSKYEHVKDVKAGTLTATVSKLSKKAIDQKKHIKCYVVAYKKVNGKKVTIAKTIVAHAVGAQNKKATDAKSIKLTKTSYELKVGKSATIKATTVKTNSKLPILSSAHTSEFRYSTTNSKVATVSKDGKITAKAKGTCTVYVYAVNGLAKAIKVTVK